MNKEIHIAKADLLQAPKDRQFLPDPSRNVDLQVLARCTPELEAADRTDVIVLDGMRYKIRAKDFIGSGADTTVEFGLLEIGRINVD
jgi:hypothetical protein